MYQDFSENALQKPCRNVRDIKTIRKVTRNLRFEFPKSLMIPCANDRKDLAFETIKTRASERPSKLSTYAVNRDRNVVNHKTASSDQTGSSSSESPMLQRWKRETFGEQPFHNLGAVIGVTSDTDQGRPAEKGEDTGGKRGS